MFQYRGSKNRIKYVEECSNYGNLNTQIQTLYHIMQYNSNAQYTRGYISTLKTFFLFATRK